MPFLLRKTSNCPLPPAIRPHWFLAAPGSPARALGPLHPLPASAPTVLMELRFSPIARSQCREVFAPTHLKPLSPHCPSRRLFSRSPACAGGIKSIRLGIIISLCLLIYFLSAFSLPLVCVFFFFFFSHAQSGPQLSKYLLNESCPLIGYKCPRGLERLNNFLQFMLWSQEHRSPRRPPPQPYSLPPMRICGENFCLRWEDTIC